MAVADRKCLSNLNDRSVSVSVLLYFMQQTLTSAGYVTTDGYIFIDFLVRLNISWFLLRDSITLLSPYKSTPTVVGS